MKVNELIFPKPQQGALATLFIQSTTGGDGITWTSNRPGKAGNDLSIAYLTPAGATTTISIVQDQIIVQPKAAETNTGLLAAVIAATNLVSGVVVVAGGDLIVARAAANLAGGVDGTLSATISAADATIPIAPGVHYWTYADTACFINVDAVAVVGAPPAGTMPLAAAVGTFWRFVDPSQVTNRQIAHFVHVIGTAGKFYITPVTPGSA